MAVLYWDVDGVLRDFEWGIFGKHMTEYASEVNGKPVHDYVNENLKLLEEAPATEYLGIVRDFYCKTKIDLNILTCQPVGWIPALDKWLGKWLVGVVYNREVVDTSLDKLKVLEQGDTLVEDHPELVGNSQVIVVARKYNLDRIKGFEGEGSVVKKISTPAQMKLFLDLFYLEEVNISQAQKISHTIAKMKGFWDSRRNSAEVLCLMHSEISEALEELRKENFQWGNVVEELADCCIRIFDYCGAHNLDLENAVLEKLKVNFFRVKKHGKRF